ncbi:MAG: signal peptide peptidase SppA [Treponema sp.]|nr:signal peptide peptidase SppA [Treponema sp.]
MKNSKKKTGIIVFAILAVIAVLSFIYEKKDFSKIINVSVTKDGENASTEKVPSSVFKSKTPKNAQKYIAKLFITGVIAETGNSYDQKWLLSTIEDLKNDEKNMGIILFINSPGGSVYETDEVYLALMDYKKNKPVYAYFASMAASGGYYMSCAADYIMANRNTLCGCIGVLCGQFTDLTGLMDKYGIKSETIHAGKNKNMGNYNEPVTDEQRAIMQSIADECYDQFTNIVADARGLSKAKTVELSDGRLYTAKQALDNRLIDSIGSWDELVEAMKRNEFENNDYEISEYKYEKEDSLYHLFMGMSKLHAKSQLPDAVEKVISSKVKFPAYIYPGYIYN